MSIDFTNCKTAKKYYDGLNGNKLAIYYNDELYMLKFPKEKHIDNEYASGTINEYISSNIFKILGFNTQDTLLGYYQDKIVVAYKDFEGLDKKFFSFGKVKNSPINANGNKDDSFINTDLHDTLNTIQNQELINPDQLKSFYYEMFIADTLIANYDRHNGNWGFLLDKNENASIAPIFDCGCSLYPKINTYEMEKYLNHTGSLNDLLLNQTTSAIMINNKKINPQSFLKETTDIDIIKALNNVYEQINQDKINELIDSTELISDIRKDFYKTIIKHRANFLEKVREKHLNKEQEQSIKQAIKPKIKPKSRGR